jgi:hypothetical protein
MSQGVFDKYKNGDVLWANYPVDDPNDPHDFKPRNVLLLDKFSSSYYKVVCITDLVNITTQRGIAIYVNSDEATSMKLIKDSFINFSDCQTIPAISVKFKKGKCPEKIFQQVLAANL